MKTQRLFQLTAATTFFLAGCEKPQNQTGAADISKKLAELEAKNQEAIVRQSELERELEDQKLAAERDAIERERLQIERDREELQRQQGEAATAQAEIVRKREEALAQRENQLERVQTEIVTKQTDQQSREQQLSDRERDLAGREAIPFQSRVESEPVADYGLFHESLSSYGSWFESGDYGYVWQPAVVSDSSWRPYTRGRWACSDRGWTWVSDEPFGWATYHYGRWAMIRGRGWVWVPGSEWAPSWCAWRESGEYIGWAPLPPETLAYRGHRWDSSVEVQFGIGAAYFSFVETRHFDRPIYQHCLPYNRYSSFFSGTRNVTNIHVYNGQVVCGGPAYREVCDRVGRQLPFYRLEMGEYDRQQQDPSRFRSRIRGNKLYVSAPNVNADWNEALRPRLTRGNIGAAEIERGGRISEEQVKRYRESRDSGRQRADKFVRDSGGAERFEENRRQKWKLDDRRGERKDPQVRFDKFSDQARQTDGQRDRVVNNPLQESRDREAQARGNRERQADTQQRDLQARQEQMRKFQEQQQQEEQRRRQRTQQQQQEEQTRRQEGQRQQEEQQRQQARRQEEGQRRQQEEGQQRRQQEEQVRRNREELEQQQEQVRHQRQQQEEQQQQRRQQQEQQEQQRHQQQQQEQQRQQEQRQRQEERQREEHRQREEQQQRQQQERQREERQQQRQQEERQQEERREERQRQRQQEERQQQERQQEERQRERKQQDDNERQRQRQNDDDNNKRQRRERN